MIDSKDLYDNTMTFYNNAFLYDAESDYFEDIDFWLDLCDKNGDSVLELACGTGRVGHPLIQEGFDYHGLDFSKDFVLSFQEKVKFELNPSQIRQGDMRDFSIGQTFQSIIMPYNALAHLYDFKDLLRCFNSIKKHLSKNGVFSFQIFNPDVLFMNSNQEEQSLGEFETIKGERFTLTEKNDFDRATQINTLHWAYQFESGEKINKTNHMRMFFPQEIDSLLYMAGFEIINKYGDLEKTPFSKHSNLQIIVAKAR